MKAPDIVIKRVPIFEGFKVNPGAKSEKEILDSAVGMLTPKWMSKEEILKEFPRK